MPCAVWPTPRNERQPLCRAPAERPILSPRRICSARHKTWIISPSTINKRTAAWHAISPRRAQSASVENAFIVRSPKTKHRPRGDLYEVNPPNLSLLNQPDRFSREGAKPAKGDAGEPTSLVSFSLRGFAFPYSLFPIPYALSNKKTGHTHRPSRGQQVWPVVTVHDRSCQPMSCQRPVAPISRLFGASVKRRSAASPPQVVAAGREPSGVFRLSLEGETGRLAPRSWRPRQGRAVFNRW